MEPYIYKFTLTRVIDGDTIKGNIDLGFHTQLLNQSIRLINIDTPEIRGPEKEEGLIVKEFVKSFISNKDLRIKSYNKDSFGRVLADVFYKSNDNLWYSLSALLLDLELANPY